MLKVDIDSYDVDLTAKILELGYRPRFIMVEHNEKFPPGTCLSQPVPDNPGLVAVRTGGAIHATCCTTSRTAQRGVETIVRAINEWRC